MLSRMQNISPGQNIAVYQIKYKIGFYGKAAKVHHSTNRTVEYRSNRIARILMRQHMKRNEQATDTSTPNLHV